jgi:hypothetical protein
MQYPPEPPRPEEIIRVMRQAVITVKPWTALVSDRTR